MEEGVIAGGGSLSRKKKVSSIPILSPPEIKLQSNYPLVLQSPRTRRWALFSVIGLCALVLTVGLFLFLFIGSSDGNDGLIPPAAIIDISNVINEEKTLSLGYVPNLPLKFEPGILRGQPRRTSGSLTGRLRPQYSKSDIIMQVGALKNSTVTWVTAYYPIQSKRPSSVYMDWIRIIAQLNCSAVVFVPNEKVGREISAMRPPSLPTWTVVKLPLKDFHVRQVVPEGFWEAENERDLETNHSSDLYTVWAEKVFFVERVMSANPYFSSYFLWMDIGFFREGGAPFGGKEWPNPDRVKQFPEDRVIYQQLEPLTDAMLDVTRNGLSPELCRLDMIAYGVTMQGGFFSGTMVALQLYAILFEEHLIIRAAHNCYAGKDQPLVANIALLYPERLAFFFEPNWMSIANYYAVMGPDYLIRQPYIDPNYKPVYKKQ